MMYDMPMHEGRELPRFTLREIDLPDIGKWDVGYTGYIVMKVELMTKVTGSAMGLEEGNDANKIEAGFRMLSIRPLGVEAVDAKTLETKEFQQVINKIKSGEL